MSRSLILFLFFIGYNIPELVKAKIIIDGIIVTVNNECILKSDLDKLKEKIEKGEILNDIALAHMKPEEIKQNADLQLEYLIHEKILESEVKRLNLSVTMDRVEQELREIARNNGVSRDALPRLIESQGMKFSTYQNYLKTRIEHQQLIDQEVTSRLKISDEDLESIYYEIFQKRPSNSFQVTLHHIYFSPKKGKERAKKKAEEVLDQIKKGMDFALAANQFSEDPKFQNDGLLGVFQKEDLDPSLVEAIEIKKEGLIPKIIETRAGIHIFLVKNFQKIPDPKFLAQKEKLRAILFERQLKQGIERWFGVKKREMDIKRFSLQ